MSERVKAAVFAPRSGLRALTRSRRVRELPARKECQKYWAVSWEKMRCVACSSALRPASIRTLGEHFVVLGACWGPNVMVGAAILTSASELAEPPSRAKGFAQSPGTRHLLERNGSLK